jgi:hypothetical protein
MMNSTDPIWTFLAQEQELAAERLRSFCAALAHGAPPSLRVEMSPPPVPPLRRVKPGRAKAEPQAAASEDRPAGDESVPLVTRDEVCGLLGWRPDQLLAAVREGRLRRAVAGGPKRQAQYYLREVQALQEPVVEPVGGGGHPPRTPSSVPELKEASC